MGRARWIGLALAGLVACQGGGEEPDGGERDSGPLLDGGFQDTGPRVPPDPTVGREGGVLVAGAARVEIPRDALSADVALTIRQLDSGAVSLPAWLSAGSAVYEVEPSTALAVPARITLPLASGALASELSGALILTQDASGEWVTAGAGDDEDSLPNDADAERGLVSAQVRHFSRFVVAVVRLGASYSVEPAAGASASTLSRAVLRGRGLLDPRERGWRS